MTKILQCLHRGGGRGRQQAGSAAQERAAAAIKTESEGHWQ